MTMEDAEAINRLPTVNGENIVLRVLDKSSDLAFVHGVVGQGVFALLGASALVQAHLGPACSVC